MSTEARVADYEREDMLYKEQARLVAALAEARAQIAAKDEALDALDEAHQITQQNLWQDITELRASLAGKEQEHQDFRLQNDAEWRAKLDHLKAQIAAKDAAFEEVIRICQEYEDNDMDSMCCGLVEKVRAALL